MRDEFYESRKQLKIKLKDIDPNYEGYNVIFINESLTIKNPVLFRKVRQSCFFGHLMAKLCVGKQ